MGGRGVAEGHSAADHAENAIAVVGVDYGYLGEALDASPILFVKDRKQRWYFAILMPCKGTGHVCCVRALVEELLNTRHSTMIVRSDNEPAIVALREEAITEA